MPLVPLTLQLPPHVPLYVDLDGTLVQTDTLHELVLLLLKRNPFYLLALLWWCLGGKAHLKRQVSDRVVLDAGTLPWHAACLAWVRQERASGRPVFLATAADARIAQAVADTLGCFQGVLASNGVGASDTNLSQGRKRQAIEQHAQALGADRYAYAGNSADDLPVWAGAAAAVAVNTPAGVLGRLQQTHPAALVMPGPVAGWRTWLKAIRITQWAKNALLFVPLLAAHRWDGGAWALVLGAFVAFGLCASATYLVNDLLDLPNDRRHPHKRFRPLAAGRLPVAAAVGVAAGMLALGLVGAWCLSPSLFGLLLLYTATTLAYSLRLKRVVLLDVLVLSALYTLRLVAGAVPVGVELSNWLLAISVFLFLSLALVKRCAELEEVLADGQTTEARGRGYHQDDLASLRAMGVSSGFLTVLVLALYVDSQTGRALYAQPGWLWGGAPLLLWWIMRMWLKTSRRELRGEDPLQFALRDPFSWVLVLALGVLGALATGGL
jgi:4-hydroxybenzoate polyprenyltransferase